jgi:hypothetical protein
VIVHRGSWGSGDFPAKFSLNIKSSLLRYNEKIAIVVTECFISHGCVGHVHMNSKSVFGDCVSMTTNSLQAFDEIHFFCLFRKGECIPDVSVGSIFHV